MIKAVITLMDTPERLTIEINKGHITRFIEFNKSTEHVTSNDKDDEALVHLLASMFCDKYLLRIDGKFTDVKYSKKEAEIEKARLESYGAKVEIV